ncbi:MAG: ABC transporter substrate-binding protein, partial [Bryobacteraceae bacterium]|nr:ABC transporter substrate-binding protein [Bryobacteraceae bacterium]
DLKKALPGQVADIGPSLDQEFLWFNQSRSSPVVEHKKSWFRNTAFRKAVSLAINRADLCRIVYRGHAIPSAGPVPPTNRAYFNFALKSHPFDVSAARKLLTQAGFRLESSGLRDASGNAVSFSLLTNGGNRAREQMAALMQRDLKAIGIVINIVTLDFPALLSRMTRTNDYEAILLGLVVSDPDPNYQMNVWLSSGANHQWNPRQKSPETPWEAEIDKLIQRQASAATDSERKSAFNRVQEILYEQEPFIYLVHPNALAAFSPRVKGVKPVILRPQLLWNIEELEAVRKP